MATLQKIRNRGPLLLIVIGLALLAFILGDAWKMIRPNQGIVVVGEIDGKSVSAQDYQNEVEKYAEIVKFSLGVNSLSDEQYTAVKDEVWNTIVRKSILQKETRALGLTVTDKEVQTIIEDGTAPILANTPFRNEATGQFDVDYLKQFLSGYHDLDRDNISSEYLTYYDNLYNFWLYVEDNIKTSILYDKYISIIQGSILSNPVSLKNAYETRIKRADVLLAAVSYFDAPDSLVKVRMSDVKRLYNEKKGLFNQTVESRDIVYIDYEIQPSAADRAALYKDVEEYASQLADINEDFASFIRLTESSVLYSEVPRRAEALPKDVAIRLDSVKNSAVFGPYYNESDDSYNAFRVLSKSVAYDSIQFCLIQIASQNEIENARIADSVYNAIKGGASFSEVAKKYSQKGEPQWIGSQSYEGASISGADAIYLNKLNSMSKGELANLKIDNANLIIKVTDVKNKVPKYNVAIVKREAIFSNETSNKAYNDLSAFVASNNDVDSLKANAEKNGYRLLNIPDFQSYQNNVGDVAKSHEALRWVFDDAKVGDVSKIFEVGDENNHLLVVGVNAIFEKGYRSFESMQSALAPLVIKDKKAEYLSNRLSVASTMDQLKAIEGVEIDTIPFVNFTTPIFLDLTYSNEAVIGPAVFNLQENQLSAPFKGEGGVFVAQKITPDTYPVEFDREAEKYRIQSLNTNAIINGVLQELYFKANVEDVRYKTF